MRKKRNTYANVTRTNTVLVSLGLDEKDMRVLVREQIPLPRLVQSRTARLYHREELSQVGVMFWRTLVGMYVYDGVDDEHFVAIFCAASFEDVCVYKNVMRKFWNSASTPPNALDYSNIHTRREAVQVNLDIDDLWTYPVSSKTSEDFHHRRCWMPKTHFLRAKLVWNSAGAKAYVFSVWQNRVEWHQGELQKMRIPLTIVCIFTRTCAEKSSPCLVSSNTEFERACTYLDLAQGGALLFIHCRRRHERTSNTTNFLDLAVRSIPAGSHHEIYKCSRHRRWDVLFTHTSHQ